MLQLSLRLTRLLKHIKWIHCLVQLPVFPAHCLVQVSLFPQTSPGDVFGPVCLFYAVLVYQQLSNAIKY